MIIISREKKATLPPFALFRVSYMYWLPFVNIFLFSYCYDFAYSNSVFLVLYIIAFKYSISNLPHNLELLDEK